MFTRKDIHILFELIACILVIPFLLYVLFTKKDCLSFVDNIILWSIVIGTFIVDGGLLYSYLS